MVDHAAEQDAWREDNRHHEEPSLVETTASSPSLCEHCAVGPSSCEKTACRSLFKLQRPSSDKIKPSYRIDSEGKENQNQI